MANETTEDKKKRISDAQQRMFLFVLVAALAVGTTIVMAIYLVKYIKFNAQVVGEKEDSIRAYTSVIQTAGVCTPAKGQTYTLSEINKCNPNTLTASQVAKSLKGRILNEMASNKALESVARGAEQLSECYNSQGDKYSYEELYEGYRTAGTDAKREEYLTKLVTCSALRVAADALPAALNTQATLASLSYIIGDTGLNIESLTSNEYETGKTVKLKNGTKVGTIAIPLVISGTDEQIEKFLEELEHSIREFAVNSATIEWSTQGLGMRLNLTAYYAEDAGVVETTKKVVPEGVKE